MKIQGWFPLGLTGWISLQSKGLLEIFSNRTVQKHQFYSTWRIPGAEPNRLLSMGSHRVGHDWSDLAAAAAAAVAFFKVQLSHPYVTTGKIIALTRLTFVSKVTSLFFNMLSRLVIAFLPRKQACFYFMAKVTMCSGFGAQENQVPLFSLFLHLFAMKWWDRMQWCSFFECWVLSWLFHSPLSLLSRGSLVLLYFLP